MYSLSPGGFPDAGADGSASASEKCARPTAKGASSTASAPVSAPTPKLRSCVICRRRKVRCDKESPCSNCRRANIACVFPSSDDRPPRWARRLERLTNDTAPASAISSRVPDPQAALVMERLRGLEGLVKELSSQLEQTNATAGFEAGGSASAPNSAPEAADSHGLYLESAFQNKFGRLVLKDGSRSRYVSSGFWSRVDDELHGLKMDLAAEDSDSSEEYHHPQSDPSTRELASSIQELDRTPQERHAFFFRHGPSSYESDEHEFQPLPSQIPFLLDTYSENVNLFLQAVHMPTVHKMTRSLRGRNRSLLSASDEALLFSIYYAAVISMEEDDVINNFGTTKGELSLKYRLGLEHALAKADFLNSPNLTLVQALGIFLALARRHDSPRFVWMMTGLAIRMAQSLGLQRDGSHFPQVTPYEVEIRRRIWWGLCVLDIRSSEDQGMDYTIAPGSFDTKFPQNINDADINIDTKDTPSERHSLTDMTMMIAMCKIADLTRRMMDKTAAPSIEEQRRLVNEMYATLERDFLQHSKDSEGNAAWWVCVTAVRLTMAKMTLFINFPVLFAQNREESTTGTRNKLLVAAIEVAEWNHALNAEPTARQWRWLYQTYTHWHAIVILLIEIARRSLSPIVERAWLALRSEWLIPAQGTGWDKKLQIWVPLRSLMATARRHRNAEIQRLTVDGRLVAQIDTQEVIVPAPASACPFLSEEGPLKHWNSLFEEDAPSTRTQPIGPRQREDHSRSTNMVQNIVTSQQNRDSLYADVQQNFLARTSGLGSNNYLGFSTPSYITTSENSLQSTGLQEAAVFGQTANTTVPSGPSASSGLPQCSINAVPWLWADMEPTMEVFDADLDIDMDSETDWHTWLVSAKNLELSLDGTSSQTQR